MGTVPRSGRKKGFPTRPLLRIDIEQAQRNTKSGMAAARYLHVNYATYKKYAKFYGLFDVHKNEKGVGIRKGKIRPDYSLEDIFAGKAPYYSRKKLKERLIAAGLREEKCEMCGFAERRIIDNQCPLTIVSMDDTKPSFALDNIKLLCYNCNFLTNASISVKKVPITRIEKDLKEQLNVTQEELEKIREEAIKEAMEELRHGNNTD